jgi:hypothetical protein
MIRILPAFSWKNRTVGPAKPSTLTSEFWKLKIKLSTDLHQTYTRPISSLYKELINPFTN